MGLSSNELFHFTEFRFLKSILNNKAFFPRYSLEFCHLSDQFERRAPLAPIPMVCFCDIPLEMTKEHRQRYKNFGIAMTESWKLKNKLNPITYYQFDSDLANVTCELMNTPSNFIELINDYYKTDSRIHILETIAKKLRYQQYFIKQYENKENIYIEYAGKVREFEKRRFYDEREWRYIPFQADKNEDLFITIEEFDNETTLKEANNRMRKYKLSFEIDDISFLIVESEKQRAELNQLCESIFSQPPEIKVLD
jgi:hypothetical protein